MATTYPADMAEAAKWSKATQAAGRRRGQGGGRPAWDPSVQSLVAFPQVIQMMGTQPDWVQKLGDAFLASSEGRARRGAAAACPGATGRQSEVQRAAEGGRRAGAASTQQTVIKIEPANPKTVYVPTYNPTVVYGAWPYPAYPPYY